MKKKFFAVKISDFNCKGQGLLDRFFSVLQKQQKRNKEGIRGNEAKGYGMINQRDTGQYLFFFRSTVTLFFQTPFLIYKVCQDFKCAFLV